MDKIVFILPVPSTGLASPKFEKRLGRKCALQYVYEGDHSTGLVKEVLEFDGVEAFKATYCTANSLEVLDASDKVLELGSSLWLNEIKTNLRNANSSVDGLKHYRIYFDDGPCYEFIARTLAVLKEEVPTT